MTEYKKNILCMYPFHHPLHLHTVSFHQINYQNKVTMIMKTINCFVDLNHQSILLLILYKPYIKDHVLFLVNIFNFITKFVPQTFSRKFVFTLKYFSILENLFQSFISRLKYIALGVVDISFLIPPMLHSRSLFLLILN